MEEVREINEFMSSIGDDIQVIWGATFDQDLGENVKITLIATGYKVTDIPGMPASLAAKYQETTIEPVKTVVIDENFVEKVEDDSKSKAPEESSIDKTIRSYYPDMAPKAPEVVAPELPIIEVDQELETFDLEDLEDEEKLKKAEKIPAWKRRIMGK
jgi:cell division protein FtsZ